MTELTGTGTAATTGTVSFRAMRGRDLDAVVAIAGGLATAPQWARDVYQAAVDSGVSPRRIAMVAELRSQVAGLAVASLVAGVGEIETIAVAAEMQGGGIGRGLLRALLEELRAAGAEEVVLEVRESNVAAARLYGGAGFTEIGRRRGYYAHPVEDAILLGLGR